MPCVTAVFSCVRSRRYQVWNLILFGHIYVDIIPCICNTIELSILYQLTYFYYFSIVQKDQFQLN